jgi:hypothetical protein
VRRNVTEGGRLRPTRPCSCQWADDEADGESGPSPYIERLDPNCPDPEHRAAAREDTDGR